MFKVRNGSRVGQVGRVELGGQVRDLDPSLLNSRNLSWVGEVGQVEFGGQVNYLDSSAPFCEPYACSIIAAHVTSMCLNMRLHGAGV